MVSQTTRTNVLGVAVLAIIVLLGAADATGSPIISEMFSGASSTNLVGTTTSDGNDWIGASNTSYKQDGSVSGTLNRTAYLPFTLTQGAIYTLQVDLYPTPGGSSDWLAAGFSIDANDGNAQANSDGGTAHAWLLLRQNGLTQAFNGPNTNNKIHDKAFTGNTAKIVLDTTNAADYTAEYFDGNGSLGAPVGFGAPAIGHVFISSYKMSGSFDNFILTPEPATMAMLALGGVLGLQRRRRQA